jgi:hypothetical protein
MKLAGMVFAVVVLTCAAGSQAEARSRHHYGYQGGHYLGGHGSAHRGGHYVNPRTGNRHRHHTPV